MYNYMVIDVTPIYYCKGVECHPQRRPKSKLQTRYGLPSRCFTKNILIERIFLSMKSLSVRVRKELLASIVPESTCTPYSTASQTAPRTQAVIACCLKPAKAAVGCGGPGIDSIRSGLELNLPQ